MPRRVLLKQGVAHLSQFSSLTLKLQDRFFGSRELFSEQILPFFVISYECSDLMVYNFVLAAYSKVVVVAILHMPNILDPKWSALVPIWRYTATNHCVWKTYDCCFFCGRLLWISSQSVGHRCCCLDSVSPDVCVVICVFHWKTQLPEEMIESCTTL